jgi:2-polyprenyl-3-methyl-5-hydroxy-6-metoxy-1,4-benzoquinol methylase
MNKLKTPYPNLYRTVLNKLKHIYFLNVFFKLLNPGRHIEIYHIKNNSNFHADKTALDIGCGDGFWSNYFAKSLKHITGIDPYEQDIKKAKQYAKPNTSYVTGASEELEFSNNYFDNIISVCVFEHLYNDEKAFSEMHRVLKPGGILAATVDSLHAENISQEFKQWHNKISYCNQLYTIESITEKLNKAGFQQVKAFYIMGSKLAVWWEMLTERIGVFSYILVPIIYPIIYLTQRVPQAKGYKLFVKAVK